MKKTNKPKPVRTTVQKLIRRKPKQARGQLRVDEILDAAERLTRTTSWEKLSTNHIAREAGIPIGSLYQFFANKHAVAQALVERYVTSIEEVFADLPESIETMSAEGLVNTIFDRLLMVTQKHDGFHAMLMTMNEISEIGEISAPIRNALRSNLERVLAARAPWLTPEECRLHALLGQITSRAVFAQALGLGAQGDQITAQRLMQQARIMQIAYYERLLQKPPQPASRNLAG